MKAANRGVGVDTIPEGIVADQAAGQRAVGAHAALLSMLDSPSVSLVFADVDGTIVTCSRGAEYMFRYGHTEMNGRPITVILPEPPREATTRPVKVTGLRKDGSQLALEVSVTSTGADTDQQCILVLHDVTRRKRIEDALHKQAAILRRQAALLDLAHDAICLRELGTGTILSWNEGAERMYG